MTWAGVNFPDVLSKSYDDEEDPNDMNLHEVDLEHRREEGSNQPVSLGEVGAPQRFRHIKNRKYMRRLYIILAALGCIFIFSSLLRMSIKSKSNNNDNSESNSESESNNAIPTTSKDMDFSGASTRLSHLLIFMKDNTLEESEKADWENASSPQRFALQWISDEDPLQLEIPETRFDEVFHPFIQRYSAAVLAFSWGLDTLLSLGFLSGEHECNWNAKYVRPDKSILNQGIICEKNQTVKLVLQTIGISGSIPREIGHMRSIQHLHLDGNSLTGKLPPTLHRLQDLSELTLTRNKLTGHLPPFISKMASLRHIELSKNLFSGHLAYPFGAMSELENEEATDDDVTVSPIRLLALDSNSFNGPLDALSSLTKLEELYINDNDFTGQVSAFFNSTELTIIVASSNKLAGKVPDYLLQLPSMTIVDLHSNAFTDKHPHGNSTVLKFLDLHNNMISGPVPRSIGKHPNLAYLDLSKNQLTSLPETMGRLKHLQYLFLSHNPTLEAGPLPEWILELTVLSSLSLKNTARIGELPEWLGRLNQLTMLDLELNFFNSSIPVSMAGMTSAEYIFLNRNMLVGTVPESLGNLTELVLLNLDHNSLTGLVPDSVCAHDFDILVADCASSDDTLDPLIECACCSHCCLAGDDSCNTRDWSIEYGDDWGNYYERYNIIGDNDVFQLVGNVDEDLDGGN